MVDSKSYDAYLKYHDYDRYNFYFNPPWFRGINEEEYKKSINLLSPDTKVKNTYSEAFKLLFKYINNGHVFNTMHVPNACKYISYALRNKVHKEKHLLYDDKIFDIFKKFVTKYKEAKSITTEHCADSIVLIDYDIFEQMHILYTLYEKYAVFAPTTDKYRKPNINCPDLKQFSRFYNDFIKEQNPTNKSLYDVLKYFEERVTKTMKDYKDVCTDYDLTILPLKSNYFQEEVKSNTRASEKQQTNQLPTTESRSPINQQTVFSDSSSQISHLKTALHKPPEMAQELGVIRLEESERERESKRSLESQEVELSQRAEEARGTEEVHTASTFPQTRRLSGYLGDITIPDILTQTRFKDNSLATQQTESPIEDKVFFANAQNAFSAFMNGVDPVPVVGVSGGMGALFLLFRYTPVGAFFRGGRGRVRRIPSGFHGQFLGAFPDIQDYEAGHIGYGPMNPLAE
ncbi:hypothetical protein, conserved [Plasmodium vivax]|uniref:VIR protein n=1 Tax=Plasmodium vivax TaxID=5855 RepID=A0A1G4E6X8_PLAVI|nr:hypothetical protein, conserved [Plasmodium vivax]